MKRSQKQRKMTDFIKTSSKANKWITEQTIKIFLEYYFSLDWVREFLMDYRVRCIEDLSYNHDFETSLFVCRRSFHVIVPTATGIFALFDIIKHQSPQLQISYYNRALSILYFHRKAIEADHSGHHPLSALWKELTMKELNTPSAWSVYVMVKCEESRIMGYEGEMMYWESMKDKDHQSKTITENIVSVSKYHEVKVNDEEWKKYFKSRKDEARMRGNTDLTALWNLAENHTKDNYLDFNVLAAWCLYKTCKSDCEVPTLWKAASYFFEKEGEKNQFQYTEIAVNLSLQAEKSTKEIKKLLFDSSFCFNMARNAQSNPELADLWTKAAIHCIDRVKHLRSIICVETQDEATIRERLKQLQQNTIYNPYSFAVSGIFQSIDYLKQFKKMVAPNQLVEKLVVCGFIESSKILVERINKLAVSMKEHFHAALSAEKKLWNPLSTDEIYTNSQHNERVQNWLFYRHLHSASESYLGKVTSCATLMAVDKEFFNSVGPSDAQLVSLLRSFASRDQTRFRYPSLSDLITNINKEYDKAMNYEMQAQKSSSLRAPEVTKFYRMMVRNSLTVAKWRETMLEKNLTRLDGYFDKALQIIQSAEDLLQNAIKSKAFTDIDLLKAQKLQQIAEMMFSIETLRVE